MNISIAGVPVYFGEIVQKPDRSYQITGTYKMPCGCELSQKCVNHLPMNDKNDVEKFVQMSKLRLLYWLDKRIPWHQCSLVSHENPNGIIPKEGRGKDKTPPFGYLLEKKQSSDAPIEGDKPTIPPHQQRVIDEQRELDEKLANLGDFIDGSPVFAGLPVSEQMDLKSQRTVMQTYSCILSDRIARFGSAA